MRGTRWLILLLIAAAVLLAVVYAMMPRPVAVDIAKVARGPLQVTIEEEGKTRVRDRFVVSAPVAVMKTSPAATPVTTPSATVAIMSSPEAQV